MIPSRGRSVYYIAIGCSSILLFSIEPIVAKSILPAFGGSAGVWVAAMLFFQVALLLGYLYAWRISRAFKPRTQSLVHGGLLILSLALLPVRPRFDRVLPGLHSPLLEILWMLLVSVGLPYFLLSATSPLLQSWFAASYTTAFPWRLFAISNAASVAALLAYPVLIEPNSRTSTQMRVWSVGYAAFVAIACAAALLHFSVHRASKPEEPPSGHAENRPVLWILLAACASVLWLAVANHLSQEVAPVPFLWVLPLSIYLLSFILCFESEDRWYRPALFRWLLPAAWIVAGYSIASAQGLLREIGAFSFALFVWCMFCHGELARTKPAHRRDLTFFYATIALGGAVGGLFVAVAAPLLFHSFLELPIGIAASVLLAMPLLYGMRSKARLIRLALVAAAAFVVATGFRTLTGAVIQERNFYGALEVIDGGSGDAAFRSLYNGRTLHGVEFLSAGRGLLPTAYYGPESGVGQLLSADAPGSRRVGVVGLGIGTLAAYGRKADSFRFYEINPAVIRIASKYFHFLSGSAAQTGVLEGDGRLLLEREPSHSFDVLVLDAFSDDTIPVHLMTKEVFQVYFRVLRPTGALAIHLTNRYIDLDTVVDALAAAYGKQVRHVLSPAAPAQHILDADWAIISGTAETKQPHRLWTDDYSNLFEVLK